MTELRHTTGDSLELENRFASRAAHMKPSEIRSLFAVASRPEIVSLAGGMPNLSALPMDMMAEVVRNLVATNGTEALQYGSGQGHPLLREQICEVMALEGIRANPDDVIVTTGSQQALDLISRIFIDSGDVLLVEAPSYVGALGTFAQYQAAPVHVETDNNGMVPAALAEAIKSVRSAGRKIKFLYLIPIIKIRLASCSQQIVALRFWKSVHAKRFLSSKIIHMVCLDLIVRRQMPCAHKIPRM